MRREVCVRAMILCLGFWVTALGSSFIIGSNLGSDGFTLVTLGIAKHIGLTVGTTSSLLSLSIALCIYLVDKTYIKIGTVLSILVLGPGIDFWTALCAPIHHALNGNFVLRLICIYLGIFIASEGIAIVFSAKLGTHVNEAVPVVLCKTILKQFQFRTVKIMWDFSQVVIGTLLGALFGVGTILAAISFGPILQKLIPVHENFVEHMFARWSGIQS